MTHEHHQALTQHIQTRTKCDVLQLDHICFSFVTHSIRVLAMFWCSCGYKNCTRSGANIHLLMLYCMMSNTARAVKTDIAISRSRVCLCFSQKHERKRSQADWNILCFACIWQRLLSKAAYTAFKVYILSSQFILSESNPQATGTIMK